MNGAQALVNTLKAAGIEVCFSNPGTSEMHLLEALDKTDIHCVLGLAEGVVSGAADGYARMAGKPAVTLLHLGPGFSNAMANIHNARRGHSPMVNIVGDHASYHMQYDAPLTSDVEGCAQPVSAWVKTSKKPDQLALDVAEAIGVARQQPGKIATLIVPADVSWGETLHESAVVPPASPAPLPSGLVVKDVAAALESAEPTLILLGGAVDEKQLKIASAIAEHSGASLYCETFPNRIARGQGRGCVERLPYLPEMAADAMKDFKHVVLVGAQEPVAFFAYPHFQSVLLPQGCKVHRLADLSHQLGGALELLAEQMGVDQSQAKCYKSSAPELASGEFTPSAIAQSIGALLTENTIIVDEGITGGAEVFVTTENSPAHDWIIQGGGAIGWGLPAAVGAAVACPDRKVLALEGDGSGMYTNQALWTMARQSLDITVVIFANRNYAILQFEYLHAGAKEMGESAASQMSIGNPDIDYAGLAKSMGVSASKATSCEEFNAQLEAAMATRGPHLIEAIY